MNDRYYMEIEAAWTEFTMHSQKILIGNIYRHPKDTSFFEKFQLVLEKACHRRENLILVGDFNCDMKEGKNSTSNLKRELLSVLHSHSLQNVTNEETRITENSQTLIDLCIVNEKQKVNKSGVLHLEVSDHSLIYLCYKIKLEKAKSYIRTVKNHKKVNIKEIQEALCQIPWSVCSVFDNVDNDIDNVK